MLCFQHVIFPPHVCFFVFVFQFSQISELTRYAELVCDDLLVQTLPMHLFLSLCQIIYVIESADKPT